jgi:hypothetical protein
MKAMKHVSLFLVSALVMWSCTKDDVTDGQSNIPVARTVNDLVADTIIGMASNGQPYGSGRYTLFSFETNKVVPSADSATSKWDIGLRGTTLIINGGNSGPGQGGAFVHTGLFDDMKTVPADSTFRTDNAPSAYAIPLGSNRGWYVYNAPANLVTAIPGRVLVIRTGSGKYAKMEILNYYKGGVTPAVTASEDDKLRKQRFYTFRYLYQPNGTKVF